MREGMLWFDNSDVRDLKMKIERAASYYKGKYGTAPSLCFIHPSMALGVLPEIDGIEVRVTNAVLPNHFWIGTSEQPKSPVASA